MLISRTKYRRLRHRVSYIPYYWRKYEKKFPKNSTRFYYQFKIDYLTTQSFYTSLTRYTRIPLAKKVFITKKQYRELTRYAKINKRLQTSLKRNQGIKFKTR